MSWNEYSYYLARTIQLVLPGALFLAFVLGR
jgi:hypothetical protein